MKSWGIVGILIAGVGLGGHASAADTKDAVAFLNRMMGQLVQIVPYKDTPEGTKRLCALINTNIDIPGGARAILSAYRLEDMEAAVRGYSEVLPSELVMQYQQILNFLGDSAQFQVDPESLIDLSQRQDGSLMSVRVALSTPIYLDIDVYFHLTKRDGRWLVQNGVMSSFNVIEMLQEKLRAKIGQRDSQSNLERHLRDEVSHIRRGLIPNCKER